MDFIIRLLTTNYELLTFLCLKLAMKEDSEKTKNKQDF